MSKPAKARRQSSEWVTIMKCELCQQEETNGNLLCQACTELIHPPFELSYTLPGTELSRALTAELAPYLYAD